MISPSREGRKKKMTWGDSAGWTPWVIKVCDEFPSLFGVCVYHVYYAMRVYGRDFEWFNVYLVPFKKGYVVENGTHFNNVWGGEAKRCNKSVGRENERRVLLRGRKSIMTVKCRNASSWRRSRTDFVKSTHEGPPTETREHKISLTENFIRTTGGRETKENSRGAQPRRVSLLTKTGGLSLSPFAKVLQALTAERQFGKSTCIDLTRYSRKMLS
jgi:hypothetical protein